MSDLRGIMMSNYPTAAAVIESLKANGWRWSRPSSCWYKRASDGARQFAKALASTPDSAPTSEDAQCSDAA